MEGNYCIDDYSKKIGCGKKKTLRQSHETLLFIFITHRAFILPHKNNDNNDDDVWITYLLQTEHCAKSLMHPYIV